MQMLGDVTEVYLCINVEYRFCQFWRNMLFYILLESVSELLHIFPFHSQTCSVGVSAKVDKQVFAAFDS